MRRKVQTENYCICIAFSTVIFSVKSLIDNIIIHKYKRKKFLLFYILFIIPLCLISPVLQADSSVSISFNTDFKLRVGNKSISPIKAVNVSLVTGIDGNAVHIPEKGYLEYPAKDLFNIEEGTISLWLKLDYSPWGIEPYRDRDKLPNGDWGDKLHGSPYNRTIFASGLTYSCINSYIGVGGMGTTFHPASILKKFNAGEWHQLVFSWKKDGSIRMYIDGSLCKTRKCKNNALSIGPTLTIGSGGRYRRYGIEASIDEFKIYRQELSKDNINAEYTKYKKLRIDLLDYALYAGRKNEVRFQVRNISKQIVNQTINISGKKFDLSLRPSEIKEINIDITPNNSGLYKIVCHSGTNQVQTFETYALALNNKHTKTDASLKLKLVQEINCAKSPVKGEYTDAGTSRVVKDYRESTVLDPGIGFAYRMQIPEPGKPYWLEVEYPDDANRTFIVFVYPYKYNRIYTTSLDSIGIITGGIYPLTERNHTKKLLFWPDCNEIAVTVVSYKQMKNHYGPAVAKLRLYENVGPLPVANVPKKGRSMGRWNEDPTMPAGLLFNHKNNYKDANLDFWHIKWSRAIDYMKFMGLNTWVMQVMDYAGDVTAQTASIPPSGWSYSYGYVPGWDDLGAAMLEEEDLFFYARLNPRWYHQNNWLANGLLKISIDDIKLVKNDGTILDCRGDTPNNLHPAVLKAYKSIIRIYRNKFKKYKNFKGICFNETIDFSFGSLENGYGNYTISLFEKETGIKVPVSSPIKRYEWLMEKAQKQWLEWRCKKITEFAAELGKTIQEEGNKKLKVQLWIKADRFLYDLDKWPDYDVRKALSYSGIDLAKLNKLPGITVVPTIRPDYPRVREINSNETYLIYSSELERAIHASNIDSVNIFRHSNLEIYPSLVSKKYRFKNFWHPAGSNTPDKICEGYATPLPNTEFALDAMTNCLAEFDVQNMLHGWWGNVENGEHEAFRKFYIAYRNIPAEKYDLVPGKNDPVAVRAGDKGFYLVNREGFPVTVKFKLNGKDFRKKLAGNEVYSQELSTRPKINNVETVIPDKEINYLKSKIQKIKLVENIYAKSGENSKKLNYVIKLIEKAMSEGRYSRARHLMYTQVAQIALNEVPITIQPEFDWLNKKLIIEVRNIDPTPFSGSLTVKGFPSGWIVDRKNIKIKNIKCGESKFFVFSFKGKTRLKELDIFRILLQGNGMSKEYQYRFACHFASEEGFELPYPTSWLTSDWNICGNKHMKKRLPKRILARYTLQWTTKCKGLRVLAEIDDTDFFPPTKRGQMYNSDSIQIYFDQKNNAVKDAIGYDNDDIVFQAGLLNGKPEVWLEYGPGANRVVDVPVKIEHKDGKTYYDVFIPKRLLPLSELTPGKSIGFGILVNQVLVDKEGKYKIAMSPFGASPYLQPGNWQDFYLSTRRPNASANVRIVSRSGNLNNVSKENCNAKVAINKKSISLSSPELTDKVEEFSATFTPETDGIISLILGADWMDSVKYLKVSAKGARVVNGDFTLNDKQTIQEKWKTSSPPPRFDESGVDIPYGRTLSQSFMVKKNVPVRISIKASLPDEAKQLKCHQNI